MMKRNTLIICIHVAFLIKSIFARAPPPECTNCGCCVNNRCIDSLASNLTCLDGCKDGYWGDRCYNYCNRWYANCAICHQDKHKWTVMCDSCKNGFFSEPGTTNCKGKCPDNCLTCSASDVCTSCKNGFYSLVLKSSCECQTGKYGNNCDTACPENCYRHECDRQNGTCLMCKAGIYGDKCTEKCSENCIGGSCTQSNGECSTDLKDSPRKSTHTTIAGFAIGGLTGVGMVSIFIVIFLRKRRRRTLEPSDQEPTYDQEMAALNPTTYEDLNRPGSSGSDEENYDILHRPMSNIYVNTRPASNIYENTTL